MIEDASVIFSIFIFVQIFFLMTLTDRTHFGDFFLLIISSVRCGTVSRAIFIGRHQYAKMFLMTNRFYRVGKLMAFNESIYICYQCAQYAVALLELIRKKDDSFHFFFRLIIHLVIVIGIFF